MNRRAWRWVRGGALRVRVCHGALSKFTLTGATPYPTGVVGLHYLRLPA